MTALAFLCGANSRTSGDTREVQFEKTAFFEKRLDVPFAAKTRGASVRLRA